jgi:hypothetical protein
MGAWSNSGLGYGWETAKNNSGFWGTKKRAQK